MLGGAFTLSGFALARLAAPPGILGPHGAKRGAGMLFPAPRSFLDADSKKLLRGPKTKAAPARSAGTSERTREGARDFP